jgi:phosphoribosylformimino-5-aminoimidazole carboxamide ribotide isomerase
VLIIPAIDIRGGRVVRLLRGNYQNETVYSDDPVEVARRWQSEGAKLIHVVDLDGALCGKPQNIGKLYDIVKNVTIPVQAGGGIRASEVIADMLETGVSRVILSSRVVADTDFLRDVIRQFGSRVAIGIDASGGAVATDGWTKVSSIDAVGFAKELEIAGVKTIIYTDISRDGTLTGVNINSAKRMLDAVDIDVIISGGVGGAEDIRMLKNTGKKNLYGVIVGKALYEGKVTLSEMIEKC